MILMDFSAIAYADLYAGDTENLDLNLTRHKILNTIRAYNKKHRSKYGELVICCDSTSWRKKEFEHYKYKRSKDKSSQNIDWDTVFKNLNQILHEIETVFPYHVIKVDGAESDDIIGALVEQAQEFGQHEDILIIANDHDYKQLQRYNNVKLYSNHAKKFVKESDPTQYLFEHIIKGDKGDGVPNILSVDNSFVDDIRQKAVTKPFLKKCWEADDIMDVLTDEQKERYKMNKKLIDIREMPNEIRANILKTYSESEVHSDVNLILNFMIKMRMRNLIECIEDFKNG
jgi:hypothetical protein